MNGAQTVEARAKSGGTSHYSDGTDAPRAPIVPNSSYAAVVARPKAQPPRFGGCFCRRSPLGLGGQRVNGAQTVEPRARSGGTAHYSDGTDAPRAPIVPNAS